MPSKTLRLYLKLWKYLISNTARVHELEKKNILLEDCWDHNHGLRSQERGCAVTVHFT